MDAQQIKACIDVMAASDLDEMEIGQEGWTLRLVRRASSAVPARAGTGGGCHDALDSRFRGNDGGWERGRRPGSRRLDSGFRGNDGGWERGRRPGSRRSGADRGVRRPRAGQPTRRPHARQPTRRPRAGGDPGRAWARHDFGTGNDASPVPHVRHRAPEVRPRRAALREARRRDRSRRPPLHHRSDEGLQRSARRRGLPRGKVLVASSTEVEAGLPLFVIEQVRDV